MSTDIDIRAKEFLSCLGNGKTEYQLDAECDMIDEEIEQQVEEMSLRKKKEKYEALLRWGYFDEYKERKE